MTAKNDAGAQPPASEWTDPDDAPELTEEFFADAEHFHGNTFIKRGRGRPPTGNAKELVSLRLDQDVLAKLREAGPGWQSQVSGLLRQALHMQGTGKSPDVLDTVRKLDLQFDRVQQELRSMSPNERVIAVWELLKSGADPEVWLQDRLRQEPHSKATGTTVRDPASDAVPQDEHGDDPSGARAA